MKWEIELRTVFVIKGGNESGEIWSGEECFFVERYCGVFCTFCIRKEFFYGQSSLFPIGFGK